MRCSEDSCFTRVSVGEDCCLVHQIRICQATGCNKGIGKVKPRKTDWIENHLFGKEREGYLIKEAKKENLCRDHQMSFLMNTCHMLDCEEEKVTDEYCKKHNNGCAYKYDENYDDNEFCPSRISNSEKYCYLHSKTCLSSLDIIKVKKGIVMYYHFGIYLGKNNQGEHEIFDLSGDNTGAKIRPWIKDKYFMDGAISHITAYHPIVPFKERKTIIGQIIWAKDNNFRKGEYCLCNRNCEHLANSITLGIDYSRQVYARPIGSGGLGSFFACNHLTCKNNDGSNNWFGGNNNKGERIKLIEWIKENNGLNQKSDYETKELEERHEAKIEQLVNINFDKSFLDCIIM